MAQSAYTLRIKRRSSLMGQPLENARIATAAKQASLKAFAALIALKIQDTMVQSVYTLRRNHRRAMMIQLLGNARIATTNKQALLKAFAA